MGLAMYTPVPVLVLLALLAGAFGLVPSPNAQAVVHTLLVATLAVSVLHLQVLAGARLPMLAVPGVLLVCATLFSFVPRFSRITPILFLVSIVATLATTACLFQLSPASHPSSEKPLPSPRTSIPLVLLLSAQLSYTLATAFCIPPALHISGPPSPLVVSLVSVSHLSSTDIFRILDTAFTVLALLFICAAYYYPSRVPRRPTPILTKPSFPSPSSATTSTTSSTPPPTPPLPLPPLCLPPGTRISPGPAPRSPVLITPPPSPVPYKRAWSWHTTTDDPSEHEEGDFRDLRDPFAPVPLPAAAAVSAAPPSAYRRWAGPCACAFDTDTETQGGVRASCARRPRSSSYDACVPPPMQPLARTQPRPRMSAWGRLPLPLPLPLNLPLSSPDPSPSHRVHFTVSSSSAPTHSARSFGMRNVRPRTPPPPPCLDVAEDLSLARARARARDKDKDKDRDRDESAARDPGAHVHVHEDALIAQKLLVRLGGPTAV